MLDTNNGVDDFDMGGLEDDDELSPNLEDEATLQKELEATRLDVSLR